MYIYFYELNINDKFMFNGNLWIKKSTRTAYLPQYNNRIFYFSKKETCKIIEAMVWIKSI